MKLKHLEMTLQRIRGYHHPQAALEQYQTPAPLAARLLYHALMKGDIEGKTVCDLGCGTGVLAIGAALLGADRVRGVDRDPNAMSGAQENAALLGADVEFIAADVRDAALPGSISGLRHRGHEPAIRGAESPRRPPVHRLALAIAPVTYSIFNAGPSHLLKPTQHRGRRSPKESAVHFR